MSTAAPATSHFDDSVVRSALRRALARVTPRVVVATLAVGLAMQTWSLYEAVYGGDGPVSSTYLSRFFVN